MKPTHVQLTDPTLARLTEGATWHQVCLGWSGAAVYRLDAPGASPSCPSTSYLKLAPALAREVAVMQLFGTCGVPAPRVLHYAKGSGGVDGDGSPDALLTSALEGTHGVSPEALAHPEELATSYADGLRSIHDHVRLLATASTSPDFDRRLEARLAAKERVTRAGKLDGERLQAMRAHMLKAPTNVESDLVFTHGDYCLPNVIFQIGSNQSQDLGENEVTVKVVGFVDLGDAGVADRYCDLASAVWSLRFNGLADYVPSFLRRYADGLGQEDIDRAKLDWYITMDHLP